MMGGANMVMNIDNYGRLFEKRIWASLKQLDNIDKIYDENQIRKAFGWQAVGVDFLICKGDFIIAIQTKYKKTRRREDHGIQNFIKSLDYILEKSNKKLLVGLWISRIKPFDDNISYMLSKNIECIYNFDCMDTLVDSALQTTAQYIECI